MATTMRQPFNPRGEYVARRGFKCNGHSFNPGDDFPWKRLAIDIRKLHRLWEHLYIEVKGGDISLTEEPEVEESEVEESSEEETEEEETEEEETDDDEGQDFIFDPEVHTLDHPETGQWLILKAGEVVLRVERKEWKRLEKKTKPTRVNMDRVVTED